MLFGTIFGVLIIPGLYYLFARLADGRKLIKDEETDSLTQDLVHAVDDFSMTEENNHHA